MSKQKIVIIGSGLGGLSCGLILSRNGYDVTILEQGAQVGGCLQCFTRQARSSRRACTSWAVPTKDRC